MARVAVDHGQDFHLVSGALLEIAVREAPDEGFIDFDDAASASEVGQFAVFHSEADAVGEEPCAVVLDFEDAAELVGGDALLACHHEGHRLKHLVQGDAGVFETGSHLDGELLAALSALPEAETLYSVGMLGAWLGADAFQLVDAAIDDPAMGASDSIRPKDRLQMPESCGFIMQSGL